MIDRGYAAAVIARVFGITRCQADSIALILSGDELDIVETAAKDSHGPVRIATVIYVARTRAARRLPAAQDRWAALREARNEACEHYRIIEQSVPQVGTDAKGQPTVVRNQRMGRAGMRRSDIEPDAEE